MGKYATVVVDPPWDMGDMSSHDSRKADGSLVGYSPLPYQSMPLDSITALPIGDAMEADAWLFCWTVNKYLRDTFGIVEQWAGRMAFLMTWVKPGGAQPLGLPAYNTEYVVVGKCGAPKFTDTRAFKLANCWPRGGHSEKPEGFYDLLRRVTPGPRLDVFGRRRIAGFDSWGNEAPEGLALPDRYQQVLLEA